MRSRMGLLDEDVAADLENRLVNLRLASRSTEFPCTTQDFDDAERLIDLLRCGRNHLVI